MISWLFGSKSKKSTTDVTTQRQQSAQNHPPPANAQPVITRRDSVTQAHHVAEAFNTGNLSRVNSILGKHRVTTGMGATPDTTTFAVKERNKNEYRSTGPNQLSQMKSFYLDPLNSDEAISQNTAPTITATYLPTTTRSRAWTQTTTGYSLATDQLKQQRQTHNLTITPSMNGCTAARQNDGSFVHVQPHTTGPAPANATQQEKYELQRSATMDSTRQLKGMDSTTHTFGPQQYGRFSAGPNSHHMHANMFIMRDAIGDSHVLSQSIYFHPDDVRTITTQNAAFSPQRERSSSLSLPKTPVQQRTQRSNSVGNTPPFRPTAPERRHSIGAMTPPTSSNAQQDARGRANSFTGISPQSSQQHAPVVANPEARRHSLSGPVQHPPATTQQQTTRTRAASVTTRKSK